MTHAVVAEIAEQLVGHLKLSVTRAERDRERWTNPGDGERLPPPPPFMNVPLFVLYMCVLVLVIAHLK